MKRNNGENSKVSIVIASYNDPNVVIAIKSAFAQTYSNKEIIVVDDGSDKATANLFKSVEKFIDILLVQKNQGQSIARNNGIKKATGKYILNLDSDDYFEPTFCEKAIKKFEEDEQIKIVTCKANRFNKKGKIDVFTPRGGNLKNFLFANSALGSSMFKREDWQECGGYEEKLPILGFEDWEFYIQLLKNGGYAYVIPEILFNYQIREGSTTSRIKHLKQEKFKHIVLKHKELYKNDFEGLIENIFGRIEEEEKEKIKCLESMDAKIGKNILNPLRYIKSKLG